MTIGLVIIFHKYPPYYEKNYHFILSEYFKKQLLAWRYLINKVYLVNSNGFFEGKPDFLENTDVVVSTFNASHAQNLNHVISMVNEDVILLMDHDTVIYDSFYLAQAKGHLKDHDVVSYIERPNPGNVARFSPYLCFIKREALEGTSKDFSEAPQEGHLDPLAKLTHEMLKKGATYFELPDDRSRPGDERTGAYHIRNFMGGIVVLNGYHIHQDSFNDRIRNMPPTELQRIFGWNWLLNELTLNRKDIKDDIYTIVSRHYDITPAEWDEKMIEFKNSHNYIKL